MPGAAVSGGIVTTHPNRSAQASAADLLMLVELALYQSANRPPHWIDTEAMWRAVRFLRRQAASMQQMQAHREEMSDV